MYVEETTRRAYTLRTAPIPRPASPSPQTRTSSTRSTVSPAAGPFPSLLSEASAAETERRRNPVFSRSATAAGYRPQRAWTFLFPRRTMRRVYRRRKLPLWLCEIKRSRRRLWNCNYGTLIW